MEKSLAEETLHSNLVMFKCNLKILCKLSKTKLYIPIWLCSNLYHICTWVLQTNLYIPIWLCSNIGRPSKTVKPAWLYIPIWLCSNQDGIQFYAITGGLYIPIWLCSNDGTPTPYPHNMYFTFQSGYVQIIWKK